MKPRPVHFEALKLSRVRCRTFRDLAQRYKWHEVLPSAATNSYLASAVDRITVPLPSAAQSPPGNCGHARPGTASRRVHRRPAEDLQSPCHAIKNPALARWGKPVKPVRKIQSPPAGDSTSVAGLVTCERCPKANRIPLTATQLAAIPNAKAARTVKNKVAKLRNKLKARPT